MNTKKTIVVCVCPAHATPHTERPSFMSNVTTPKKIAKVAFNIFISEDLRKFAKEHFKTTGYRDSSGFFEAMIRLHVKRNQTKIRKAGLKIPPSVFTK
jgi:hypothetical protein